MSEYQSSSFSRGPLTSQEEIDNLSQQSETRYPLDQKAIPTLSRRLGQFSKRAVAELFREPVDYVGLRLDDYLDVVKNPMDLKTLKKNLDNGKYKNVSQLVRDAVLIFDNCRLYNGDSQDRYYKNQANKCQEELLGLFSDVLAVPLDELREICLQPLDENSANFTIFRLQQLIIKLGKLAPQELADVMREYCRLQDLPFSEKMSVRFNTHDVSILRKVEALADGYLQRAKPRAKRARL